MSIALQRSGGNSLVHSRTRGSTVTVPSAVTMQSQDGGDADAYSSSSSSSIGYNSDEDENEEVQSSVVKGPLDTMVDALEEVLPIKRGISEFYSGKSKSFTSLADISEESPVKDLAKPENPYSRKRKNLIAHHNFHDESFSFPPKVQSSEIQPRQANFGWGMLTAGRTLGSHNSISNIEASSTVTSSASQCLPPLHPPVKNSPNIHPSYAAPQRSTPARSFSLSDLQHVVGGSP